MVASRVRAKGTIVFTVDTRGKSSRLQKGTSQRTRVAPRESKPEMDMPLNFGFDDLEEGSNIAWDQMTSMVHSLVTQARVMDGSEIWSAS